MNYDISHKTISQTIKVYSTMGQYWTRKSDHEDVDERTANPWSEAKVKGDRAVYPPKEEE